MTEEQLTKANKLKRWISELEDQYNIVQTILCAEYVTIGNNKVGSVRLRVNEVMPALTYIQDKLTQVKESARKEFDEL